MGRNPHFQNLINWNDFSSILRKMMSFTGQRKEMDIYAATVHFRKEDTLNNFFFKI